MNVATTSRTTETATCPPTSNARPHRRRRPKPAASVAFITAVKSAPVDRIAGANPNRTALTSATTRLTSNARRSSSKDGDDRQIRRDLNLPEQRHAGVADAKTERRRRSAAISRLSVISCRIIRGRPAPMASRRAISRARTGARLVSSPATLAHATNSTAPASRVSIASRLAIGGCLRDPGLQLGAHGDALIPVRVRVGPFQIRRQ